MLEFSGAPLSDLWLNFVKWFNCLTLSVQLVGMAQSNITNTNILLGILSWVETSSQHYIELNYNNLICIFVVGCNLEPSTTNVQCLEECFL